MKSKVKKMKTNAADQGQRTNVLLESLDKKIDLLVDGHVIVDKKIDTLEKKVDAGFKEVDYKFGVVFDELHLINNNLKEKVSRDEFMVLEKRVFAIEKRLTQQK